jgi:hypothetical protein
MGDRCRVGELVGLGIIRIETNCFGERVTRLLRAGRNAIFSRTGPLVTFQRNLFLRGSSGVWDQS